MSADNYFITDQNAIYFLTFTVIDWIDVFTRKEYKVVIADSLNYCIENKGLEVYAWCLMSNHLHMVCQAKEDYKISDINRDFKKFTAKTILKMIEKEPESRKEWMLYRFKYAGKFDNRVTSGSCRTGRKQTTLFCWTIHGWLSKGSTIRMRIRSGL
jgi:REP element-mobilizing transposase RayT